MIKYVLILLSIFWLESKSYAITFNGEIDSIGVDRVVEIYNGYFSFPKCIGIMIDTNTVAVPSSCGSGRRRISIVGKNDMEFDFVEATKDEGLVIFRYKNYDKNKISPLVRLEVNDVCENSKDVIVFIHKENSLTSLSGKIKSDCKGNNLDRDLETTIDINLLDNGTSFWSSDGKLEAIFLRGFWGNKIIPAAKFFEKK